MITKKKLYYSRVLFSKLVGLSKRKKIFIFILVDSLFLVISTIISFFLRLGYMPNEMAPFVIATALSMVISLPIFYYLSLYRFFFRSFGKVQAIKLVRAGVLYACLYSSALIFIEPNGVPRTLGLIQPLIFVSLLLVVRFGVGSLFHAVESIIDEKTDFRRPLVIFDSGLVSRNLGWALRTDCNVEVVGFLEVDAQNRGRTINGVGVIVPDEMEEVIEARGVKQILIPRSSDAAQYASEFSRRWPSVESRILPSLMDLVDEVRFESDIDFNNEMFLGRDVVSPDYKLLTKNISGKTVLVTGAGGSIGRELCKQILSLEPLRLILFDMSEFALYDSLESLRFQSGNNGKSLDEVLVSSLGSVQDLSGLRVLFTTWKPDTVFHTAAYKHVSFVEQNIVVSFQNNVLGTKNLVQVAAENKIQNFVMVSTDKAVKPTNVMGATKRLGERIVLSAAQNPRFSSHASFSVVRFGNVLDSSGSVVPKFRRQIIAGGPITVTHSQIERFFMTTHEAAQLVIQASSLSNGGDVFVLDMGEPKKILDLAKIMIRDAGLQERSNENPDGDVEITITGLREGEKLTEELWIYDEYEVTQHSKIFRAIENQLDGELFEQDLAELMLARESLDIKKCISMLTSHVEGFKPSSLVLDQIAAEAKDSWR